MLQRPQAVPASDGLDAPQRYWAWAAILLTVTLAVLDGTIANVALPTIAADFDASPSVSIWIVNGYQLAIVVSLLPLASLGEIFGYRRVYLAGVVAVHRGVACLRAVRLADVADGGARSSRGFGAAGADERQHGAVALCRAEGRSSAPRIGINALSSPRAATFGPGARRFHPDLARHGRGCSPSTCRSASSPSPWACSPCRQATGPSAASTGRARFCAR